MKRYCMALDLEDDPDLISAYQEWHKAENGWPEVNESILAAGVRQMEIYCVGNRLFMIMETEDSFSFERKAMLDAANPKVQEWEKLMWRFQRPLPFAKEGEKWMVMNKIYEL